MVCKNCGADLKPGIKYCLNCGYYIDEEDFEKENTGEEETVVDTGETTDDLSIPSDDDYKMDDFDSSKSMKKMNMSIKDMVIYGVLILIFVASILVMIFAPKKTTTTTTGPTPSPSIVYEDNVVDIEDYTVTFRGQLRYTVEGKNLYVTDGENFTFSYNVTKADYNKYAGDLSILTKDLEKRGYEVLGTEKKEVDSTEVIVYNLKVDDETKYLYLAKVDSNHICMGTVETLEGGNWSSALDDVVKINRSLKFKNDTSDGEDLESVMQNASSNLSKGIKK